MTRPVDGTGFARTLGATIVSVGDGQAVLRLEAAEGMSNHVGGPHAAALFGLGETAAAEVAVEVFRDLLLDGVVLLIKSAEIDYRSIATGPVTCEARLADGEEDGVRASVAERGVATFPVACTFRREDDGAETGTMTARMALKRF